jgi:hypothetical protein
MTCNTCLLVLLRLCCIRYIPCDTDNNGDFNGSYNQPDNDSISEASTESAPVFYIELENKIVYETE